MQVRGSPFTKCQMRKGNNDHLTIECGLTTQPLGAPWAHATRIDFTKGPALNLWTANKSVCYVGSKHKLQLVAIALLPHFALTNVKCV